MPYVLFRDHFPEIAERETRTITVLDSSLGLPRGQYGLLEMFCDEPGCDCRRVLFYVVSSLKEGLEAVVTYGWEKPAFYARWMKDDDPEIIATLKGPALNLGSPQSELAPAILDIIKKVALSDAAYVERIKRHYRMFRDKIDGEAKTPRAVPPPGSIGVLTSGPRPRLVVVPPASLSSTSKVNRNAPCPCGSGRKYKKCCLGRD